ncbi:MAG: GspE/PulE family protein [Patescibacteria group bacterium]|nr:GspE/PulE family protein [Patescibacteria group bacterium]
MTPIDSQNTAFKEKLINIRRHEEEERAKQLAETLDLPYVDLTITPVDSRDLAILPEEKAKKGKLAIIRKTGRTLRIAVKNPKDPQTVQILEELKEQGFERSLFIVSLTGLENAWKKYELAPSKTASIQDAFVIQQEEMEESKKALETIQELKKAIHGMSTSRLISIIMAGAIKMGVSDIHFEPSKSGIRLRYRIDGLLQDITDFPEKDYRFLLSRVKTLSGMLLNIHDTTQDGRFTIVITKNKKTVKSIDLRVSVLPSSYGESVVMRLLGSSAIQLELADLGVRQELSEIIKSQITRPNGMVLTTGPTGSGKTTTLYACLNYINKPGNKIITVEDPVEYRLKGIVQTQISKRKGQNFTQALKAIVRQDPDALMVGEIRDGESAAIAIRFALTGHMVFSTLHTNDAAGAIPRLTDMGIKPSFIPTAVNLVIAQRLMRRLCPKCKEAYSPSPDEVKTAKKIFSLISPKSGIDIPREITTFYKARGCPECHGLGYKGRIGVFEFFTISESIEKLIIKGATSLDLTAKAMEEGMITLMQDAMLRVVEGTTTIEETQRVIGSPEHIEQLYGKAIMSTLTRASIISEKIAEWAKGLVLGDKKIQEKLGQIKMEELPEWLFAAAIQFNASDIHMEAEENTFKIRLRIDGALEEIAQISKELFLPMVAQIKELAGMKIDVHKKAQDGRFKIEYFDGKSCDTRVSVIPSGYGESVIIRILKSDVAALSLKEIGIRQEQLEIIEKAIKSPNGIIFVTGPTSAGKTTTLYSILSKLNRPEVKIFTIEDPIEYRLKGVIQTQVSVEEGYTFLEALRALLRQNPNIIMLGETRDAETAQAAVQAALTGHLVLTTLHTNGAAEAVQRLTNLNIKPNDISSSLRAVVAQRLVRKLCQKCKKPMKIPPEIMAKIKKEIKAMPASYRNKIKKIELYQPGQCAECNKRGYKGQIGIFEVLAVNEEIKKKITSSASPAELEKEAIDKGMLTLYQDGLLKALSGLTTLEDIERATG